MLGVKILVVGVAAVAVIGAVGAALWYMTGMPGRSFGGALPPLGADEVGISQRLRSHVDAIARVPHNVEHYDDLERAARYIETELKALGYEPVPQVYMADGKAVRNIEVIIEPAAAGSLPGTLVIGAHYGLLYPSTGNFIAFVGMLGSRDLVRMLIRSFRTHTDFPTVGGVAPGAIPGIAWSDHWSFEQFRYPAVMITDTAPFRYTHYHETTDTSDKVDFDKLARVTKGIERMLREIVSANDLKPTRSASR